jgi:putative lipoic acid-binding regulatory protein
MLTGNLERMRIDAEGNISFGTQKVDPNWSQFFNALSGNYGGHLSFQNNNVPVTSLGNNFYINNSTLNERVLAYPAQQFKLDHQGNFLFESAASGTAGATFSFTERMRIDSSGNLLVGKTITQTNTNGLTVSANDFMSYTNDSTDSGDRCVILNRHGLNAGDIQEFRTQNTSRGIISFNGSVMSYGGTSDYRLKENIKPMENGLERLNRLNPVSFDWKETGINSEGFIAHEVQEVFADVVTGQKDGKQMQTVDYGRITPLLVKAIQEQQEQIDALQSEIQQLKGE